MFYVFLTVSNCECTDCNFTDGYECCGSTCYYQIKYFRCCDKDYCLPEYCYDSGYSDYKKCVPPNVYEMCLNTYGIALTFGILVLPTVFTLIITITCCHERPPKVSFIVDITTNLWIAVIIYYACCISVNPLVNLCILAMVLYFVFLILFRCNVFAGGNKKCKGVANLHEPEECSQMTEQCCTQIGCVCCAGCCGRCWRCRWCDYPESPLAVAMEMAAKPIPRAELAAVVNENAVLPPDVRVDGEAFNNVIWEKRREVVGRGEKRIGYGSWQEEGRPVYFPRRPLIKYRCEVAYEYDAEVRGRVEAELAALRAQLSGRGQYVRASDATTVPYLVEFAVSAEGCGCCIGCMRSPVTRALYNLLFFVGYHAVFEAVWRGLGATVVFKSRKVIGAGRGLRAEPYKRDECAANMVRLDLPPTILAAPDDSVDAVV